MEGVKDEGKAEMREGGDTVHDRDVSERSNSMPLQQQQHPRSTQQAGLFR